MTNLKKKKWKLKKVLTPEKQKKSSEERLTFKPFENLNLSVKTAVKLS
jgi:hypothetical protein